MKLTDLVWLILIAMFIGGCATVTVERDDMTIAYTAVLRDLKVDPNGIEIKTSPTAEGIVTGVVGLVVGLFL
jgi:hypothetical protein